MVTINLFTSFPSIFTSALLMTDLVTFQFSLLQNSGPPEGAAEVPFLIFAGGFLDISAHRIITSMDPNFQNSVKFERNSESFWIRVTGSLNLTLSLLLKSSVKCNKSARLCSGFLSARRDLVTLSSVAMRGSITARGICFDVCF